MSTEKPGNPYGVIKADDGESQYQDFNWVQPTEEVSAPAKPITIVRLASGSTWVGWNADRTKMVRVIAPEPRISIPKRKTRTDKITSFVGALFGAAGAVGGLVVFIGLIAYVAKVVWSAVL